MERALQEVPSSSTTIRRTAEYGIPLSTLGQRASGCVALGSKSGTPTYLLLPEEEEVLVHFLIGSAGIEYPKSVREVQLTVLAQNGGSN